MVSNNQATEVPHERKNSEIDLDKSKWPKKKKCRPAPKLCQLFEIIKEYDLKDAENIEITVVESIKSEFQKINDPRDPSYVKHKLADVLLIMLLAVIAGNNTWYDIEIFARCHVRFLTKLLGLEYGVPTDSTFQLVVSHIDMNIVFGMVNKLLINRINDVIDHYYTGTPESKEPDVISYDGKASRSSGRNETFDQPETKPLFTLNAFSSDLGMCLNQSFINKKSNEIPEMPLLIQNMDISGVVVTCDALNTQYATAAAIINGGGMYVMPVKGNKKTLYTELSDYFSDDLRNQLEASACAKPLYKIVVEKEHGGTAIREYYISFNINRLYKRVDWTGFTAVGMARRIFRSNSPGKPVTYHDRYFILGGVKDIETFARSVREHWHVENKCNWHLDFTMKDDANKTMPGNGAEGLQLMKKAALAVLNVARALFPPYVSLNFIRSTLSQGFETEILRVLAILDLDTLIKANPKEFEPVCTV